ncbi:MAG: ribbon-helix-helix domain-containing protein, partial [Brevundimonas sp.]
GDGADLTSGGVDAFMRQLSMAATRKITVELPEDVARRVELRVATGDYESESAIVTASLRAQMDSDDQFADWTHKALPDALAEWRAAPDRVRPASEVFESVLARYEARKARES